MALHIHTHTHSYELINETSRLVSLGILIAIINKTATAIIFWRLHNWQYCMHGVRGVKVLSLIGAAPVIPFNWESFSVIETECTLII